jgi:hypothetical protein
VRLEAPEVAERFEERGRDGRWDAYVLVRYPLAAIRREQERLKSAEDSERLAGALALSRAKTALASGGVGEAVPLLGEALDSAEPLIRRQAQAELHRLAAGLSLEPLPTPSPATLSGLEGPLRVRATLRGLAASGVAVRFAFAAGTGEIEAFTRTDAEGVARCRVSRLEPAPLYVVSAQAELSSFGGPQLAAPRAELRFRLKAVPWRVYIEIAEENLGVAQPHSVVAAVLAEQLAAAGIVLAANREGAEVIVAGRATTREGSDNLGWEQAAVADVRVRAVLVAEGRLLAERSLTKADFSDSPEQAGVRALTKAAQEAARAVIEGLLAAAP